MKCAVSYCNNDSKQRGRKWRFFGFPNRKENREKWVQFCRRKDIINIKGARICSAHFRPEDFERNMRYELGLDSRYPIKLTRGAIPTVDPTIDENDSNGLTRISEKQARKDAVALLLGQSNNTNFQEPVEFETVLMPNIDVNSFANERNLVESVNEIDKLQEEKSILIEAAKKRLDDIRKLKGSLLIARFERDNMEERLKTIFTEGQVNKLMYGQRRQQWKKKDIDKSITLYSTSPMAYKFLRKNNFPIPSIRYLQNWASKINQRELTPTTDLERLEEELLKSL